MTLEAKKARIVSRIWQAITTSGLDISSVPKNELDRLVSNAADGVLQELDALLEMESRAGAAPVEPITPATENTEKVLWEGRPFLSLVERYIVTTERVRIISGLVGKGADDIEMIRLKDVDHTQGVSERMMGIGDIHLRSGDASTPVAVLRNVQDPEKVHEIIRRAMINARKQHPFHFEQEM